MSDHGGDPEERFRELYRDGYRPVLAYAARRVDRTGDAEDVAAETFTVAWRRLADVPEGEFALPWLLATARRVLANHHRGGRRRGRLALKLQLNAGAAPWDADRLEHDEELATAVAGLSASDREILLLAAWEELPHAHIAKVLGIAESTVAVRLHRARKRLVRGAGEGTGVAGHEPGDETSTGAGP